MSGFQHDIAGGSGDLVVTSMQSPNFVSGSAGWQVAKNGDAEFNSGIFRGTVEGSSFVGDDFVVNDQGLFLYSGPAAFTLALLQRVTDGPYMVEADEFGSAAAFTVTGTTGAPYGFTVATSSINNVYPGTPGAYPHIWAGNHFGHVSPGSPFPLQVASIATGQVKTSLNVTLANTGISDCAYDNWFNTATSPPGNNNATNGLEMMIWLASIGGTVPAGSLVASNVQIGAYTFNVYFHPSWANATEGTVSFQHTSQQTSVSYDMRPFMDYMIAQGWLNPAWYLIAIEAGFELWNGGVGHAVNSFTVSNAPALPTGSLIASIAPMSGTDAFGNAYGQGFNYGTQTAAHFGIDNSGNVYIVNASNNTVMQLEPAGGGAFFYSPSAGFGKLVMSLAPAAGTDQYGNTFPAGLVGPDAAWIAVGMAGGWSNRAGYPPFRVKRLAQEGMLWVQGTISNAGAIANGATIASFGAGYFNTTYIQSVEAEVFQGSATVTSEALHLEIDTSGNVKLWGINAAGSIGVSFNGFIYTTN